MTTEDRMKQPEHMIYCGSGNPVRMLVQAPREKAFETAKKLSDTFPKKTFEVFQKVGVAI